MRIDPERATAPPALRELDDRYWSLFDVAAYDLVVSAFGMASHQYWPLDNMKDRGYDDALRTSRASRIKDWDVVLAPCRLAITPPGQEFYTDGRWINNMTIGLVGDAGKRMQTYRIVDVTTPRLLAKALWDGKDNQESFLKLCGDTHPMLLCLRLLPDSGLSIEGLEDTGVESLAATMEIPDRVGPWVTP